MMLDQVAETLKESMRNRPIFVVGVSRSGTTLMRKTLNSSDQIAISKENHFMGHLIASEGIRYKFRQFGDLRNDNNVRQLVDFVYTGELEHSSMHRGISTQWAWLIKKIPKEEFLQRILASDRSERALFTVMMETYADWRGKPIMGEKTPAHVRYVPTLLEWYPEAKIVHMLRDPRANFVSELRRRKQRPTTTPYRQLKNFEFLFKLYIVLQTMLVWLESAYRAAQYQKRYPDNYYLMKFEDLVSDSEKNIKQLCDFLGVEFQDKMLQQVVVSEGFQAGQSGFDANAANRWKKYIDPWIDRWFVFWFKGYMKKFGYINQANRGR
jgi:hypothetical protein